MNYMPTGWLAPDGTLYECNVYDHISLASKIIKNFNYKFVSTESEEDFLLRYGWTHITKSLVRKEYILYWNNFLTDYQKNYLKPYFDDETISIFEFSRLEFKKEMEK